MSKEANSALIKKYTKKNLLYRVLNTPEAKLKDIQLVINIGLDPNYRIANNLTPLEVAALKNNALLGKITESEKNIFKSETEIKDFTRYVKARLFTELSYSQLDKGISRSLFTILRQDMAARVGAEGDKINEDLLNKINDGKKIDIGEGKTIEVMPAYYYDRHAIYFVFECDENNIPTKLSYCDGNANNFPTNIFASGYSSGEIVFNLDPKKLANLNIEGAESLAKMKEYLSERLNKTSCRESRSFVESLSSQLSSSVEQKIPTKTQVRGNCPFKSFNLAVRACLSKVYPTLVFEQDGKPAGDGYETFKRYKNGLNQSYLNDLVELGSKENQDKFYYRDVINYLEKIILPKAISKNHTELSATIKDILKPLTALVSASSVKAQDLSRREIAENGSILPPAVPTKLR